MQLISIQKKSLYFSVITAVFVICVGVNLFAPFFSDDFFQQLLLQPHTPIQRDDASLFGLFSFIDGDAAHWQQMQNLGVLPWFSEPTFYFRFFRPVAELSLWLDFWIAPKNPMLAHLQSIIWALLCAFVVFQLAKKLFPKQPMIPVLAFAIFLWDGQHVATIHWIANRHALIAAVLAMSSLLLLCRAEKTVWYGLFSIALYVLALLASETAVALLAYIFFYVLLVSSVVVWRRALLLGGFITVTLAWFFIYQRLGFGADTGQGLYLSPFTDVEAYLLAVVQRLPIYMTSLLLPFPTGMSWIFGLQFLPVFSVISALFIVVVVYKSWRFLKQNSVISFCFLSGFVSLLPVCSTFPQDRLVFIASIGIDMGLAALIVQLWTDKPLLAKTLVFFHLVLSPLHLLFGSLYMTKTAGDIERRALQLSVPEQTLIVLQMPIGEAVALMGTRYFHQRPIAKQFYWLASNEVPLTIKPWGQQQLMLEKRDGFGSGFESAFGQHKQQTFYLDQKIVLAAISITVKRLTQDGLPERIVLDYPNDAVFMTWDGTTLQNYAN